MGKKNANFLFWSVFLSALGCTFLMYGLNAFHSVYLPSMVCCALFFWLTWAWLKHAKPVWHIVAGIILGRIILELPIRILDFQATSASLLEPVCSIAAVLLAVVCYRRRTLRASVISVVVLLLLNTIGHYLWIAATDEYLFSCTATAVCVALTWLCLLKAQRQWMVAGALCLGILLIALPFLIIAFTHTIYWMPLILCALSAIVLTTLCYRERSRVVWLLSFIVLVLLNSFVQYVWIHTSLYFAH